MNVLLKNKIEKGVSSFNFNDGLRLERIPVKERNELKDASTTIKLSKKEVLYNEGDSPKGIYVLTKGKIKITQLNVDGTVQILFIFPTGVIFGHRSILGDDKQPVTATAMVDCELKFIEKEHFLNVLQQSPEFTRIVLQSISHEYSVLVNRISIFAQRGIKERLALFLLMLNETYKVPNQIEPRSEIVINRNDLAGYIGTSVENLVRTLKVFKDNDYVSTNGKSIFINNFEELYAISRL